MIRLDRFLCDMGIGSRSQVKSYIKKGQVTVNGQVCTQSDYKLDECSTAVAFGGKELHYQRFHYYMLHKPAGVISAVTDKKETTVLNLLRDAPGKELFPVGRLDKDTEGLLLITNDGKLAHELLSPSRRIPKTYFVKTAQMVTEEMIHQLKEGVNIGDEKKTLPACVSRPEEASNPFLGDTENLRDSSLFLTIVEGRFHQVKRMLRAVGNEVVYLKRMSMGTLKLDEGLKKGEYRALWEEELRQLRELTGMGE